MSATPSVDLFQVLRELNRAFLGLLQARARLQRSCLGLPGTLRAVMRGADARLLDALADFPRALFRLRLDRAPSIDGEEPSGAPDEGERALRLSILLSARQTARQSAYQARLLLALEARDVERLAALSLEDLQRLAHDPGLLVCALTERHWFWPGLLTATRPESWRYLTLMALQPAEAPSTGARPAVRRAVPRNAPVQ